MSDTFNHAMDALFSLENDTFDWGQQGYTALRKNEEHPFSLNDLDNTRKCRFCGKTGLYWDNHEGGKRLFEQTGGLHYCSQYEQKAFNTKISKENKKKTPLEMEYDRIVELKNQ